MADVQVTAGQKIINAIKNTREALTNDVVLGALMHRFPTDKSIRTYCKEQGFVEPSISDHGAVWACPDNGNQNPLIEQQIGWIK